MLKGSSVEPSDWATVPSCLVIGDGSLVLEAVVVLGTLCAIVWWHS